MIPFPTFFEERSLWNAGFEHIAGIDEVGRGAFAGPVVTAAVILPQTFPTNIGIHDSKLLTGKKREDLARIIKEQAIAYSIAEIGLDIINKVGIGKATQQAFYKSIQTLSKTPNFILIDAFYIEDLDKKIQKPIIRGDQLSISIAAASIIAKVYRDDLMRKLSKTYPEFAFEENKGYGTKSHRDAIKQYGLCPLHRKSFDLVKYTV